ncbi:MAG: energy-coupling factor transporter ATPase, partial [Coriobacteriaceae bacterium]|nr:energy-coupling factor transporter ATPase [Coriobacteriaceae bacterium]
MPLALEQLSYSYTSYDTHVPAVRNVSLTLEDGEFLGIIGHTGSGKSTLLQLMCGLLQPTSGRVLIDGDDLTQSGARKTVHTKIGMAFQYPEYQLFAPTVAEDVAFGPRNAKMSAAEIDHRVRESMSTLGLDYERYAKKSPFELSGGEMRRVALAGVLASDPKILILDEPTAGLDPAGRNRLMRTIKEINAAGKTIIMVSHSMEDIANHATQVLVLNQGGVFAHGTPEQVFSQPIALRAINLGVPQTT